MKNPRDREAPIEAPMDVLGGMPSAMNAVLVVVVDGSHSREAPLFSPGFRGVADVDVPLALVIAGSEEEKSLPDLPLCGVLTPIPESGIGSYSRDQCGGVRHEMARAVETRHLIGHDARLLVVLRPRLEDAEINFSGEDSRHGVNDLRRDVLSSSDKLDDLVWVLPFDMETEDFFDDH